MSSPTPPSSPPRGNRRAAPPAREPTRRRPAPGRSMGTLAASVLGFLAAAGAAGAAAAWGGGCYGEAPPGPSTESPPRTKELPAPVSTSKPTAAPQGMDARDAGAPAPPPVPTDKPY